MMTKKRLKFQKLNNSLNQQKPQEKRSLGRFIRMSKGLMVGVLVLILVLSGLQVVLSAKVAVTTQQSKLLEEEKARLSVEITELEKDIAQLSSMVVVEQKAVEEVGMRKVNGEVVYLKVPLRQVLVRR